MQPLLIAAYQVGVQKDLKPFMIPDEAFPDMSNAFVWRGRVQRKAGYTNLGRLRRQLVGQALGVTGGGGAFSGNVFTILGITATQPNAYLTPGTISITVGAQVFIEPVTPNGTLSNGAGGTGTVNYATGAVTIQTNPVLAGAAVTITFFYYPALPVMGIRIYEDPISPNQEKTIFFDTRFAYQFTTDFIELVAGTVWTGSNKQQFWTTNYFTTAAGTPLIWVTNNNAADGIKYYDGAAWTPYQPATNLAATEYVITTLMIIPFKNRLVFLNTTEFVAGAPKNFFQRARWSWIGDPTVAGSAFRSDIAGFGNVADASTDEQIKTCGFIKDELIVYFERSTWKLVYTSNEADPFVWQRINQELGADSTFSNVAFDDGLLVLGNVGIHKCNGSQVKRIDAVIPDEVFSIHNGTDGPERVSAIRDFYQEIVYFAYPVSAVNANTTNKVFFPNKMIIYNYRNNTFSFTTDNATTFGYFQRVNSLTWEQLTKFTWQEWEEAWNSGVLQSGFPGVNFGNQQGFVETIYPQSSAADVSLYIQAIAPVPTTTTITSPQHNLDEGDYVRLTGIIGLTNLNDTTFEIITVPTADTFTIFTPSLPVGTYLGGGLIEVVSNVEIISKQFTPLWEKGKNYTLISIDFLIDQTVLGELSVDVYTDLNTIETMTTGLSQLGNAVVSTAPEGTTLPYYSLQKSSAQIWKRFYTSCTGETFQVKLSYDDNQMRTPGIVNSGVVIHAMLFKFEPAGDFY